MSKEEENSVTAARSAGAAGAGAVKRRYRPLPLREKLFNRVLELRSSGLSYSEIIKRIEEEFGERLSTGQVSEWTRAVHRPSGNIRYELKVGPELCWTLGAAKGDVSVRFNHSRRYYDIEVKAKPELVEIFSQTVPKFTNREPLPIRPAEQGLVRAGFQCAQLYYLLSDFEALRSVVESSLENVAAFCQGFFDAEGSIYGRKLVAYNSDFLLLLYAQKLLSKLGIQTTGPHLCSKKGRKFRSPANGKEYVQKKDIFYIYVRRRSLKTFYEKVGFRIQRKQQRLKRALGIL